MDIRVNHPCLHIFQHFGGDFANENNTTRALMITLARSNFGVVLLRSLLDTIGKTLPAGASVADAFALATREWPAAVEFEMQTHVDSWSLRPEVRGAVLVELTPEAGPPALPADVSQSKSIADALIRLRSESEDEFVIVIESKLYGRAGQDQMNRYRAVLRSSLDDRWGEVQLSWDALYRMLDALPVPAALDPFVVDLKTFVDARPHLVAFTGFRPGDFAAPNDPSSAALDTRLQRLCQRLVSRTSVPGGLTVPWTPFAGTIDRKRGGCDYDLAVDDQARMAGNLGIACWDAPEVVSKLVVGSRSYRETERVLRQSGYSTGTAAALEACHATGRFELRLAVRLRIHRFDERWIWLDPVDVAGLGAAAWREALEALGRFHHRVATDDVLDAVASRTKSVQPELVAHRRVEASERARVYGVLVMLMRQDGLLLASKQPAVQVDEMRQDCLRLFGLLRELSR